VIENRLKKERIEFYPHHIDHDSVLIDGHSGKVTFEATRWLMKHDIPLTILIMAWGNLCDAVGEIGCSDPHGSSGPLFRGYGQFHGIMGIAVDGSGNKCPHHRYFWWG